MNYNRPDSNLQEQSTKEGADIVQANHTVHRIEWSPENEMILVEWCDAAQCYKWLNTRSHQKYSYMHAWFTIPAITLSTISGTASFAQASLPAFAQTYAPMAIGSINIFIGILTTIQQYLKISEFNEAHRVSAISWDKFARNIRIELAKSPAERMEAKDFIKINRQEFDRLMETSPSLSQSVIDAFNKTFRGKDNTDERDRYDQLKKPDICNIIESANKTRHHWYKSLETTVDPVDVKTLELEKKEGEINKKDSAIKQKEKDILMSIKRQKEETIRQEEQDTDRKKREEDEREKILEYISMFENMYGRKPLQDEIYEGLKGEVSEHIVLSIRG